MNTEPIIKTFNKVFDTDLREKSSKRKYAWPRHLFFIHCHDVVGIPYTDAAESIGFNKKNASWSKMKLDDLKKRDDFGKFLELYEKKILEKTKP